MSNSAHFSNTVIVEQKTESGIFYRMTSTPNSGDCLVLVMGYGGSLRIWPATFVNKLAQTFKVITYDNRGTGLSIVPENPEEYTIKLMADDLDEVIKALDIKQHHLLGYSMGGCIALQYAHDHQELVKSLFLISSTAGGVLYAKPDKEVSAALANPQGKTLWDIYMSTFSLMYSPDAFERCMPTFKAIYEVSNLLPTRPIALAGHSNAFKGFDGSGYLAAFKMPTTILAGKEDRLMPVKNSENLAANIDGAKLILWDDCEHGPHIQEEDAVVQLISESCSAASKD
jgi:pimeloyl-ACP methyl ester carboxylesterase